MTSKRKEKAPRSQKEQITEIATDLAIVAAALLTPIPGAKVAGATYLLRKKKRELDELSKSI